MSGFYVSITGGWTNPPQSYTRCKNFSMTIKKGEENISTYLEKYVPFFGSSREQLVWSFLVINDICILSYTLILNLFVSEDPAVKQISYSFTILLLIISLFNLLLEMRYGSFFDLIILISMVRLYLQHEL